ncbi:hypothetical protein [Francisella sp. 19X1-34]|uniref:hypothetical protein n=1 Tax=Francisella sp. 19X1-34 TaxID=3087177 RepID=UPI002E326A93|nr:hypothetical protein [Francisella sp. 19X1-34]MED7788501.1 hypothetical protein [Francisella sp. 19X1-34]
MKKIKNSLLLITTLFLVSSCENMQEAEQLTNKGIYNAEKAMQQSKTKKRSSLITREDQILIATKSYKVLEEHKKLPAVFDKQFTFNISKETPINKILSELAVSSGIGMQLSGDARVYLGYIDESSKKRTRPDKNISSFKISYAGTLKGVLDYIGNTVNLNWEYRKDTNQVVFFRTQTKVFQMNMLPGKTTTKTDISSAASVKKGDGQQSFNTSYDYGTYDAWKTAENTIKKILGSEGEAIVSPAMGTITVTATPFIMTKIEKYIDKINQIAKERIAVKVEVYNVTTNDSTKLGLDWDAVFNATNSQLAWRSEVPDVTPDPFGTVLTASQLPGFAAQFTGGPFAGTKLIANALNVLGRTSYVTGTTLYTVSGKPAPIQVARTTDYVKQVQMTISGVGGLAEASVQPGTINTGYSIVVTPKILDGSQMLVNISLNMSNLIKLRTFEVSSVQAPSGSTLRQPSQRIELPDVQNKTFMQTVPLQTGQTVVLAGFQEELDRDSTNSVGPAWTWWFLGGKTETTKELRTTVVIVTPYIIE